MSRIKKGILTTLSLLLGILTAAALARISGGSFSVYAKAQDASGSDVSRTQAAPRLIALSSPLIAGGCSASVCTDEDAILEAEAECLRAFGLLPGVVWERAERFAGPYAIVLCGSISVQNARTPDSPRACLADCGGMTLIFIDCESGFVFRSLVHELCHLMDRALDGAAKADPSHWSEEGWAKLNPEGFAYYGAYLDADGRPCADALSPAFTFEEAPEEAYFISRYAKTFPTEDRATLVEAYLRLGPDSLIMRSPHLSDKISYYIEAVRYYLGESAICN